MVRTLALLGVILALALFVTAPVVAEDKAADNATHEGKVVSMTNNKLVMTDKDGKEHTHTLADTVKVRIDNRDAKADDLKPGMRIRVTTPKDKLDKVLRIEGLDKEKDFPR